MLKGKSEEKMNKKNRMPKNSSSEFRMMKMVDAKQLLCWAESEDMRYEHYTFTDYNIDDIQNWYFIKQKMIKRKLYAFFVDAVLVGFITLKKINFIQRTAEIGLAIDPAKRSRGYGEAMLRAMLEHVYLKFPIDTIYLEVADFNFRARRLYEKLGFMYEGSCSLHAYESQNRTLVDRYPEDFCMQGNFVMARVYRMAHQKDTIGIEAPAKVNLGLVVGEKKEDGYHELASAMQSVSLCDRVYVRRSSLSKPMAYDSTASSDRVSFSGDTISHMTLHENCSAGENVFFARVLSQHEGIPPEKNLVYIAAKRLFQSCPFPPVDISIDKRIPEGAGLGGGSSDAAATLIGIKKLYYLDVSDEELARIALDVGADVPFCVDGGLAAAFGRGEILAKYKAGTLYMNLYTLPVKTSTPAVFGILDELREREKTEGRVLSAASRSVSSAGENVEKTSELKTEGRLEKESVAKRKDMTENEIEMAYAKHSVRDFCSMLSKNCPLEEIIGRIPKNDLEQPAELYIVESVKTSHSFKPDSEFFIEKEREEREEDIRSEGETKKELIEPRNTRAKSKFEEVLLKTLWKQAEGDSKKMFHKILLPSKHQTIASIKKEFLSKGALYSAMSGSGSTVYAIFSDRESAERCAEETGATFVETLPARTV